MVCANVIRAFGVAGDFWSGWDSPLSSLRHLSPSRLAPCAGYCLRVIQHNVSVVFSGEHFYERLKPQKGISYFIQGGSAKLRGRHCNPRSPSDLAFATQKCGLPWDDAGVL